MSFAATLPLAFVMIAGPQIISAFFFATSEKWKADSGAYVLGAAISVTAIVTAAYVLGAVLGGGSGGGSPSRTLDYVVVALLLFAMAYVILRRKKYTETPKWMARLQTATPKLSLTLGLLLLGLFPSDLATSVSRHALGEPW